MIGSIRNPWIRRPLVVVAWPFVVGAAAVLTVLQVVCDWYAEEWHDVVSSAWRGEGG